ncbi:MAG: hypothetical protein ACK50F_05325 [Betaproteobacteria bacterium]
MTALLVGCASKPPPPTISPVVSALAQLAWQQGHTPEQVRSTLAPLAGMRTVTPPEQMQLDRLQVPAGFKLQLWAHGLPGGCAMARADNVKIYVGKRGIGRQRTVRTVVDELTQPAGAGVRADPPLQRRRLGHGGHRPRRAQRVGLRLAPGHQGTVVHRPRPRLDG